MMNINAGWKTGAVLLACMVGVAGAQTALPPTAHAEAAPLAPSYTDDGKLQLPADYREWIFLSSGLDMSYSESPSMADHSMFDNVFADPASYRSFVRTGSWPEGTMLLMETRGASEKGSINRHGRYQAGGVMGIEIHVKDSKRFVGGWAFFGFEGKELAKVRPASEACYSCHREHGAVDTTFVQFYPTLLEIATAKGTLAATIKR